MEPQAPIRQKIIREIKPSPVLQARTRNHKLRVAAYCRVSTEQEEQQTSMLSSTASTDTASCADSKTSTLHARGSCPVLCFMARP